MCQFGGSSKIIKEYTLTEAEAIIGYRINYIINSFNSNEKFLQSLNRNYIWPKNKPAEGLPKKENSKGIYNYNNYYYNNYYYNNCILIITNLWGKVFEYKEGYRSSLCYPKNLVILDKNSKWFDDKGTRNFADHFNNLLEQLAKEYNCSTIEFSKI